MKYSKIVFLYLLLSTQCAPSSPKSDQVSFPENFAYQNLEKINLSYDLEEISGLHWVDSGTIWAIEDESSVIFELDPSSGKILRKRKFAKNKDIEDLAVSRSEAWVLQSNGILYRVTDPLTNEAKTQAFDFPLKGKRDLEAVVAVDTAFLVFCKVCSWDEGPDRASVFRFDLKTMRYDSLPYFTLTAELIQPLVEEKADEEIKIQPSAGAWNPLDQRFYLISSSGKWLMILDRKLTPLEFYRLDPFLFKQPEGITFDGRGNMYISNEAQDGEPNFLKIPYQPKAKK